MASRAAKVWGFVKWILTPEELGRVEPESSSNQSSLFHLLVQAEQLPEEENIKDENRSSLIGWVLSGDSLDEDQSKNGRQTS